MSTAEDSATTKPEIPEELQAAAKNSYEEESSRLGKEMAQIWEVVCNMMLDNNHSYCEIDKLFHELGQRDEYSLLEKSMYVRLWGEDLMREQVRLAAIIDDLFDRCSTLDFHIAALGNYDDLDIDLTELGSIDMFEQRRYARAAKEMADLQEGLKAVAPQNATLERRIQIQVDGLNQKKEMEEFMLRENNKRKRSDSL